jgi:TATA-box binding protein (TBP) (component of TFIID and TFIIIB)
MVKSAVTAKKPAAVKEVAIAPRLPWKVNNVTTTAWLGTRINLVDVSEVLVCIYDVTKFPNCVFHSDDPNVKCTLLLYESGNVVTTGAKLANIARTCMYKLVRRLQKELFMDTWNTNVYNFRAVNFVGDFSTGYLIDLKKLAKSRPRNCRYNKCHFPALRMSIKDPVCEMVVFRSGKVNISGAKSLADLHRAYKENGNLKEFKLNASEGDDDDEEDAPVTT